MTYQKKTKIVATLGPASDDVTTLRKMIRAGLNVARINCSHGNHEEYAARIERVRTAAAKEKANIAILLDLAGPKIRIGEFGSETVTLKKGHGFTLTTKKIVGDETRASINYPALPKEVAPGVHILVDDGKLSLRVVRVKGDAIETVVEIGGTIRARRGVNVPDGKLSISAITAKDKKDIDFGVAMGVDFFALSFVRHESDVLKLRKMLEERASTAGIIAKIETQGAMERIVEIIATARGVMVARGDLAVEIPKEHVPLAQKQIIRAANIAGKTVITATQMLDSMTEHMTPTRAEIGDVANAIFDGTDAVMLSQETAIGIDPAHVVATMASIATHTEQSPLYRDEVMRLRDRASGIVDTVSSAVAQSVASTGAVAVVALTESGFTPRMVSRHKPEAPILALTPIATTYRQLALTYGISAEMSTRVRDMNTAITLAKKELLRAKLAQKGDVFLLVAGIPFGKRGGTNSLTIQTL
jgi:pyruvate kinase